VSEEDYPARLLRFTASGLLETGYLLASLTGVRMVHGRFVTPLVFALVAVYAVYALYPPVMLYLGLRRSGSGEQES
jgi:hypothetical protein